MPPHLPTFQTRTYNVASYSPVLGRETALNRDDEVRSRLMGQNLQTRGGVTALQESFCPRLSDLRWEGDHKLHRLCGPFGEGMNPVMPILRRLDPRMAQSIEEDPNALLERLAAMDTWELGGAGVYYQTVGGEEKKVVVEIKGRKRRMFYEDSHGERTPVPDRAGLNEDFSLRAKLAFALAGAKILGSGLEVWSEYEILPPPNGLPQFIPFRKTFGFERFCNKGMLLFQIQPDGFPFPINIMNAHTIHGNSEKAKRAKKIQFIEMRLVADRIPDPLIIMGDLNVADQSPEYLDMFGWLNMFDETFIDVVTLFHPQGKRRPPLHMTYFGDNEYERAKIGEQGLYTKEQLRLDHTLLRVRPGLGPVPRRIRVLDQELSVSRRDLRDHRKSWGDRPPFRRLSDHLPLEVDWELRDTITVRTERDGRRVAKGNARRLKEMRQALLGESEPGEPDEPG